MKALRNFWDAFMGLALRMMLGTFVFGIVMILLVSSIETQRRRVMDRETRSYLNWLVIAALLIIAVNLLSCTKYIEVPYAAILPLEAGDSVLGRMKCDANGFPYKEVKLELSSDDRLWTEMHEQVHVLQARRFRGGCSAFLKKYDADPIYKLYVEATAFCEVHDAQMRRKLKPNPSAGEILIVLMSKYNATWTSEQARAAMTCEPDGTYVKPP